MLRISDYITNSLNETYNFNYTQLETFIIYIIEKSLQTQNKTLQRYIREKYIIDDGTTSIIELDGVITQGYEDLEGPTIIEVKRHFSEGALLYLKKIFKLYPKYKSLLFVFGTHLSQNDKDYLQSFITSNSFDFKIKVWDLYDVSNLIKNLNIDPLNIIDDLNKDIFEHTVKKAENTIDWKKDSDILINDLNQSFKNDEVFFFLGAGVSKDAGVPTWDELLRDLNISVIESKLDFKLENNQKDEILTLLTTLQSGAPVISASYIRTALDDKFTDEIRKNIYKNVKQMSHQKLLKSIAKASRPLIGKLGLRGIITYNFDDLLEQQLEALDIDYKSIYREGDFEIPTKRPVYHVHGFIPQTNESYKNLDKSLLVFSEDGYHTLQNDPYSWSNLVQLKALRENTCVLIGLSGIDPNLRRLFSNFSKRYDGCKHYIILQRQLSNKKSVLSNAEFQKFSSLHHSLQESVFKEIGLKVIWYEEHTELPDIINRISRSEV